LISIYVSPKDFFKEANAGATGLFCGYFKTFQLSLPRLRKKKCSEPHFLYTKLGALKRIYQLS